MPDLLPTHCDCTASPYALAGGQRQNLTDGPDVPGQLAGDGSARLDLQLAPGLMHPVAGTEALLGLPGDGLDGFWRLFRATLEKGALSRRMTVGPGRFHENPADMAITRLRDATAGPGGWKTLTRFPQGPAPKAQQQWVNSNCRRVEKCPADR